MSIKFLKYRKAYFFLSGILILGSLFSLFSFGLNQGIDFTGGSIIEIEYKADRPENQTIKESLSSFDLGDVSVQPTGENGVIIKLKDITEGTHNQILEKLREAGELEELRFELIGPTIGRELTEKTRTVVVLALLAIVLYIAFAFRNVLVQAPLPGPISSTTEFSVTNGFIQVK